MTENKLIEAMLELSGLSMRTRLFGSHGFAKVCRSLSLWHLTTKFSYASKSRGETKVSAPWVFFGTMRLFWRQLGPVPACFYIKRLYLTYQTHSEI